VTGGCLARIGDELISGCGRPGDMECPDGISGT
jgi:hypothetical protein